MWVVLLLWSSASVPAEGSLFVDAGQLAGVNRAGGTGQPGLGA
jgi:hypothetical protein